MISGPSRGDQARILLVEDDQPYARSILRMLEGVGFGAVHASSAEEARTVVDTGSFDLAILDIGLPGDGGLVLARELQLTRPELALVVATGLVTEELRSEAADHGVHDFLEKPFDEAKLVLTITGALRRHGAAGP